MEFMADLEGEGRPCGRSSRLASQREPRERHPRATSGLPGPRQPRPQLPLPACEVPLRLRARCELRGGGRQPSSCGRNLFGDSHLVACLLQSTCWQLVLNPRRGSPGVRAGERPARCSRPGWEASRGSPPGSSVRASCLTLCALPGNCLPFPVQSPPLSAVCP